MAYGGRGFGGGMNMQALMKQAQQMQEQLKKAQEELKASEFVGSAGGGMVKVTLNGKFEMKKLELDGSLLNIDEKDILEDLIIAAYNDAKNKVDDKMQNGVKDVTGGMNLGGLKLPF